MTNKKPEQFLLSCQICQEASLWQKCIPPTVHLLEFLIAFKWSESWMRENNSVNPSSKFIFRKCILNNSLAKTCFPKYFLMRQIMFNFFEIFCWIVQKGELWPLCLVPVNLTLVVLTKHPHRDRREIRGVRANTSHEIKLNTKIQTSIKQKPNILNRDRKVLDQTNITPIKINTRKIQNKNQNTRRDTPCYKQFLPGLEEPGNSADAEKTEILRWFQICKF